MHSTPARTLRRTLAALLAALPLLAHALDYQVSIDTTPLAGTEGYLAIDLLQGTAGTTNQVQLSSFAGTAALGAATRAGDVTGTLPELLTLTSTDFFNEYLQGLSFAAGVISFHLNVSTQHLPGDLPDTFAVYLLDSNLAPFSTSDPTGAGALLVIDLVSQPLPQVYESPSAVLTLVAVPEPAAGTLALAGLAVLALLVARRREERA